MASHVVGDNAAMNLAWAGDGSSVGTHGVTTVGNRATIGLAGSNVGSTIGYDNAAMGLAGSGVGMGGSVLSPAPNPAASTVWRDSSAPQGWTQGGAVIGSPVASTYNVTPSVVPSGTGLPPPPPVSNLSSSGVGLYNTGLSGSGINNNTVYRGTVNSIR